MLSSYSFHNPKFYCRVLFSLCLLISLPHWWCRGIFFNSHLLKISLYSIYQSMCWFYERIGHLFARGLCSGMSLTRTARLAVWLPWWEGGRHCLYSLSPVAGGQLLHWLPYDLFMATLALCLDILELGSGSECTKKSEKESTSQASVSINVPYCLKPASRSNLEGIIKGAANGRHTDGSIWALCRTLSASLSSLQKYMVCFQTSLLNMYVFRCTYWQTIQICSSLLYVSETLHFY